MRWMDCLANFGLLQLDFTRGVVRLWQGVRGIQPENSLDKVCQSCTRLLVKSSCNDSKFARQSIHGIVWPHPHPRRPSPPAVISGGPILSPKGPKQPHKSKVFPSKVSCSYSQVAAGQNLPDNPSTMSLGLIHVSGGTVPQL